jgi:hypothetical protein
MRGRAAAAAAEQYSDALSPNFKAVDLAAPGGLGLLNCMQEMHLAAQDGLHACLLQWGEA